MPNAVTWSLLLGLALAVAPAGAVASGGRPGPTSRAEPSLARPLPAPRTVALSRGFEENAGQFDPQVRFLLRGPGYSLFLIPGGAVLSAPGLARPVRMTVTGARPPVPLAGAGLLPGRCNYFLGRDRSRWRSNVPCFERVRQDGVARGVDLAWRTEGRAAAYGFEVAPGGDLSAIRIQFDGVQRIEIDGRGDLLAHTASGLLRHTRPRAWQRDGSRDRELPATFALRDAKTVGFDVEGRDLSLGLTLDPVVEYSSLLGRVNEEFAGDVAVDATGAVYIAGQCSAGTFPTMGAYQSTYGGGSSDAFVTKVNAAGTALVYSTLLGGQDSDYATSIAVDGDGNAHVAGATQSTNFPVQSAYQATRNGPGDVFLARLSASGAALEYSTYFGGSDVEVSARVALDGDGSRYLAGVTTSTDLPTASPYQATLKGASDAFVVKWSSDGRNLVFGTYLGGGSDEFDVALAVDAAGSACLCGSTYSTDFPVASAVQGAHGGGGSDGFVCRLKADGPALEFSTYLGGNADEACNAVALDGSGAVYACGRTSSENFPVKPSGYQMMRLGPSDAFVLKLDSSGSMLSWSTFLGGTSDDEARDIAVDPAGTVFVIGDTFSDDFPVLNSPYPTFDQGGRDVFVTRFATSGTSLAYSVPFKGLANEWGRGIALQGRWRAIAVGETTSGNFPSTASAFQPGLVGGHDVFVTVLNTLPSAPTGLTADVVGYNSVEMHWTDNSNNEIGFEVERREPGGTFATVATVPTSNTIPRFSDPSVTEETDYEYRVRASNEDVGSAYSNVIEVTTTDSPPAMPYGLLATAVSATEIDLSWTDASDNESGFVVYRSEGSGPYVNVATRSAGTTSHSDGSVLPCRAYTYKVRAFNPQGNSPDSGTSTATTPCTMGVTLAKGKIADSAKNLRDSLKVSGSISLLPASPDGTTDPQADGIAFRLGGGDGAALLAIPAASPEWTRKKDVLTWKSPRGTAPRARFTLNTTTGAFTLAVSGLDLPATPPDPVVVWMGSGDDAGEASVAWQEKKPGRLAYPPKAAR